MTHLSWKESESKCGGERASVGFFALSIWPKGSEWGWSAMSTSFQSGDDGFADTRAEARGAAERVASKAIQAMLLFVGVE